MTSPKTAKLGSVRSPAETFLGSDVSYMLNHPAIISLAKQSDGRFDVGFRHGTKYPQGKANILFMDAHVSSHGSKQTNGIIMEFKK